MLFPARSVNDQHFLRIFYGFHFLATKEVQDFCFLEAGLEKKNALSVPFVLLFLIFIMIKFID